MSIRGLWHSRRRARYSGANHHKKPSMAFYGDHITFEIPCPAPIPVDEHPAPF
jgi:hypothetical protein